MNSSEQKSPLLYVLLTVAAASLLMAAWVLYQRSGLTASAKTDTAASSAPLRAAQKAVAPQCLPSGAHPMDQLQMQAMHAHDLLRQHSYGPSVALYREIAEVDPTFPGIQLELSMALLDAKQPEAANDAVNAQLSASSCLAELTPNQMQTYCRAEMPGVRLSTCQEQVMDLRRSAHLHAALVQMQLGREGSQQTDADLAAAPLLEPAAGNRTARTSSMLKSPPVQTARAGTRAASKDGSPQNPVPKASRNPLVNGEQTDAALGAYSR